MARKLNKNKKKLLIISLIVLVVVIAVAIFSYVSITGEAIRRTSNTATLKLPSVEEAERGIPTLNTVFYQDSELVS